MQPELIGGRYRVQSAIGQGGMGTVWLCRDETLRRDVAVKQVGLLPGESVTDSARAFREARSSAGLSHRNVVTVFDVVEEDGAIWLVMEHVPGRSLSEIIKQDGPLEPAVVADIGAQVAAGLAAAHQAGTMHRDVKPGNVLIREDGVAKISDFGIARSHGDPALTQSGFLTGTPSYFSPELARGAEPGSGTDVWALGATLYAAVEGRSPYEQKTNPVAVLHDITSGQPPRPRRAEFLEPALLRMMDRNPRLPLVDGRRRPRPAPAGRLAHRRRHPRADRRRRRHRATQVERPAPEPAGARGRLRSTRPVRRTTRAGATQPRPGVRRAGGRRAAPRHRGRRARGLAALRPGRHRRGVRRGEQPGLVAVRVEEPAEVEEPLAERAGHAVPEPSTPSASPTPTRSTKPASGTGLAAQKSFLADYFAQAPGGTDAAWAMLTPATRPPSAAAPTTVSGARSSRSPWAT